MKLKTLLILTLITTVTTGYGSDIFSLQFPDSTNRVFSLPLDKNGSGEYPFYTFVEYPIECTDGCPPMTERLGVGYRFSVTVIKVNGPYARCKIEAQMQDVVGWTTYQMDSAIMRLPKTSSSGYEGELQLTLGEWSTLKHPSELNSATPGVWKFKLEKQKGSQPIK